jgi:hypothetical protein
VGVQIVVDALLAALTAVLLCAAALIVRSRLLRRRGAVFDCALRAHPRSESPERGWSLGVARYTGDRIEWSPVLGVTLRPRERLPRRSLFVCLRRPAKQVEAYALPHGAVVLECEVDGRRVDLAMTSGAVTGLLSWVEAAPPGASLNVA